MDTVITVGGLTQFSAIMLGIALVVIGTLIVFASGMASAPDRKMERRGCASVIIGLFVITLTVAWIMS